MTANAQEQVGRMLALVPYLREREGVSIDEVARDFGVKPTQVVKDLKVLWFCGLPNAMTGDMIDIDMDALDGDGIIRLTNADYLTRPLRLAPREALALMVALRALREISAGGERDAVARALTKLEAAAGEVGAGAAAVDIHMDPEDETVRSTVEQALRERRQLDLTYYVPGRDETTQRVVDPMRLIFSEGHAYLEAWCHRVDEVRMFRLDRMTAVSLLDSVSAPPADAQRADLSRGLFQPDANDPAAVIDLQPDARWVADYYPVEDSEDLGVGGLRVRLRFSDPGWLQRLILRLGGSARLVEPTDLAVSTRRLATEALEHYGGYVALASVTVSDGVQ